MVGVAHCPPSSVAVCGVAPVLLKATTCPVLAVISAGWNLKSTMVTATAPALADSLQTEAPPDAAADPAADTAADAADELAPDEQAASMTTALTAKAASERWDIGNSLSDSLDVSRARSWVRPGD